MNSQPVTKEGYVKLKDELNLLTKEKRPNIIEKIAEARSHGDLSENAEYHAAREEQGFLEARIKYLESVLSNCEVVNPEDFTYEDRVLFGATVTIYDETDDREIKYQVVGEPESDIEKGKLSVTSPIGRAIIGKEMGDQCRIQTPSGKRTIEIMEVEYI
ncbi:MAG: transcription elongation factor GreA [bacterium]